MTSRLFDNVTFESDKLPTITSGTVYNYQPAFAYALGQADEWQGYLLYKGPGNTVISGSSRIMDTVTGAGSGAIQILIPPFATHAQVGVLASGEGAMTFGGSYPVEINSPAGSDGVAALSGAAMHWGPGGDNGLTLNNTSGLFVHGDLIFTREADIRVSAIVFQWYRRASTL